MQPVLLKNPERIRAKPMTLHLSEHRRRDWVHEPEVDVPFEALLEADYWCNLARELTVGDHIEVRPPEGHYHAIIYVRSVQKLTALVAPIAYIEFATVKKVQTPMDYEIRHRGRAKWSIMRGPDVVEDGLDTKEQAEARLAEIKAVQAA